MLSKRAFTAILFLGVLLSACNSQAALSPTETLTLEPVLTVTLQPTVTLTPTKTASSIPTSTETPSNTSTETIERSPQEVLQSAIEGSVYMTNACFYFEQIIEQFQEGQINKEEANIALFNTIIWATFGQSSLENWHPEEGMYVAYIKEDLMSFPEELQNIGSEWIMDMLSDEDVLASISPRCLRFEQHLEDILTLAYEAGLTEDDVYTIVDEMSFPIAESSQ
ncbi:MAG: hypothetical protein MUO76_20545 [Anaerolineaceae bacterium]|nr:hypothetical protein [Anaerolineaceae bacterium]